MRLGGVAAHRLRGTVRDLMVLSAYGRLVLDFLPPNPIHASRSKMRGIETPSSEKLLLVLVDRRFSWVWQVVYRAQ